ncbi:hypothetical protein G6F24_017453 [Rhizopus arrhizus]|nr:hypothetical protein G6F24_017453 [Rhizopus arrhizus]
MRWSFGRSWRSGSASGRTQRALLRYRHWPPAARVRRKARPGAAAARSTADWPATVPVPRCHPIRARWAATRHPAVPLPATAAHHDPAPAGSAAWPARRAQLPRWSAPATGPAPRPGPAHGGPRCAAGSAAGCPGSVA